MNKIKQVNDLVGIKGSYPRGRFFRLIHKKDAEAMNKELSKLSKDGRINIPIVIAAEADRDNMASYQPRLSPSLKKLNEIYEEENITARTSEKGDIKLFKFPLNAEGKDWLYDSPYDVSSEIFKKYYTLDELKEIISKKNKKIKTRDDFIKKKNPKKKYEVKYIDINIRRS
jgi:hypothetical protein